MARDALTRQRDPMTASPPAGEAVVVREQPLNEAAPVFVHPTWSERFPWVFQATTGRGSGAEPFDLSFFGDSPTGAVWTRWRALRTATAFSNVAHSRQVHGARVIRHDTAPRGVLVADSADGHVTSAPDLLLAVSIADCVPISLVHPNTRSIALLHAGWRGIAAGILERGIESMRLQSGRIVSELYCHLGPAICGKCYEVGPEVHEALRQPPQSGNAPIDLRAILVRLLRGLSVPVNQISVSGWCTRCDSDRFFSHRGGAAERQMALLGVRARS
jgi:purine-nucleoside/S-methyl-5'-thioadenosine phosphorylase / adenosine deaminase